MFTACTAGAAWVTEVENVDPLYLRTPQFDTILIQNMPRHNFEQLTIEELSELKRGILFYQNYARVC